VEVYGRSPPAPAAGGAARPTPLCLRKSPERPIVVRCRAGGAPAAAMSAHLRDPVIARLTNIVMMHGKKHAALRIIDDCLWILKRDMAVAEPVEFVKRAIDNAKPLVELKRHKAAGRVIQVPAPCLPRRQEGLALRFVRCASPLGRCAPLLRRALAFCADSLRPPPPCCRLAPPQRCLPEPQRARVRPEARARTGRFGSEDRQGVQAP
jgi:ribosomal protein S7